MARWAMLARVDAGGGLSECDLRMRPHHTATLNLMLVVS